ncbi:MAG: S-methyl-5-thioribose-1-phosphate isomerase [Planctomycetia bacterium]|nr:S-methyl-5-thioribose-1-phosphate isomerase [Planctomycetia bacterium]
MIDQTVLPNELKIIQCRSIETVWEAIKMLRVRGAPAIGISAAYGVCIGLQALFSTSSFENSNSFNNLEGNFAGNGNLSQGKLVADFPEDSQLLPTPPIQEPSVRVFFEQLDKIICYLASSRPTAVNLFWALDRMKKLALSLKEIKQPTEIAIELLREAKRIHEEDRQICRAMGKYGASLVKDGDTLLTHCNAGGLATADYGTALAVFFWASEEEKKKIHVFADETRPLLQGARLTAWELHERQIDVTLICDSMAAMVMKQKKINAVFVGADRIAANGDTANKIGTYNVALCAKAHEIPFYVVAPSSTFDLSLDNGDGIPIEERNPEEIRCGFGKPIAPEGIQFYNPAFDVTPYELISAIITEKGIISPVSTENIRKNLQKT